VKRWTNLFNRGRGEYLAPRSRKCYAKRQDELYDYCQRVKRTIREVLDDFRHVRIPRDYIFDVFPPIRPREFSIASSIQASTIVSYAIMVASHVCSVIPMKFILHRNYSISYKAQSTPPWTMHHLPMDLSSGENHPKSFKAWEID